MAKTTVEAWKLVDRRSRNPLGEGRNYGLGFAFAKVNGKQAQTLMPLSACKDYLNDFVYSEWTGEPYSAYGFRSKKTGVFKDSKFAYFIIGVLLSKDGKFYTEYGNYNRDVQALAKNYKSMIAFVNTIETELGLADKSEIMKLQDNRYLVKFPIFWAQYPYLISLYSLLLRFAMFYEKGDIWDFIKNFKFDGSDAYYSKSLIKKTQNLIKLHKNNQLPKFDWVKNKPSIHSLGIMSFSEV